MPAGKRAENLGVVDVQSGNRAWWTENTMSYDWTDRIPGERFSRKWFDEADARFVHTSRLFATEHAPFDRLIPFERLRGKRVLEVGCGMGLHSELMARAGAEVTAVDLSPTSVEATRRRFAMKGLGGDIREVDAESMPFQDQTFDFVWSWGVIHHSSRTGRIVREIARVLSPEGECRVMVYNRAGAWAKGIVVRDHILRGGFLRGSLEETFYRSSDGFSARFYVREHFEDLFRAFFADVSSTICGLDSDALPLPGALRRPLLRFFSERYLRAAQARRGSFLFVTAARPS